MELNQTLVTEFVLVGFTGARWMHRSLFIAVLLLYMVSLLGNGVMVLVIFISPRLHTPMYFFLWNLSLLETINISCIVPLMLVHIISDHRSLSAAGCFTQCFFYFYLVTMVFVLLPIMSVDRYVAICNPLRYATIMNNRVCIQLMIGSWLASLLYISGPTVIITRLPFCGPNVINHFFCDSAALMHLACVDTGFIELIIGLISMIMLICSLALTILSYTFIICTVLKIPVTGGRGKTFSTCSSHLVMVTIAYGSSIFIEVSPALNPSIELYKSVNMFSSFISPLMNPLVYTFKNNQFKEAFKTLLHR